ncbi:MAG: NUDIX hydrolase [Acidimicrobiales bacterium]
MIGALRRRLHRGALGAFRRSPTLVRRWIVRAAAPSYTAGALGYLEHEGRVLLIRQVYRSGWGLPGGHLRRREPPATAVARELAEEVGVAVAVMGPPVTVIDPTPQRIDFVFRVRCLDPTPLPRARSVEIAELGWFPLGDLPSLQFETRQALAALAEVPLGGAVSR